MSFLEIAKMRQSCRKYDAQRAVEQEKIDAILEAVRLAPSACNGQPYHITLCNLDAPVRLVVTLGYAKDEPLRPKKRKSKDELTTIL